jgi:hypothetical protein
VGAVEVKWLHGGRREERGKERREERRGERKGEERIMGKNTDHSSIYASTLKQLSCIDTDRQHSGTSSLLKSLA